MSEIKVKTIEPSTGTNLTLGTSGDTIAVSSDSVKLDTWKDSGGNMLFVSDGAGTLSSVNSGLSGAGPKLILSQTASSSTSISFTANIDSTYDKYMFVFVDMNPANNEVDLEFNGSTDGGSNYNITKTTTFFTAIHDEDNSGAALSYQTGRDLAQSTSYQPLSLQTGNGADETCAGVLYLYSPSNTTYVKQFYATLSNYRGTNAACECFMGGYFNTTSAINAIDFKFYSGNMTAGKIKMYGVA